MKMSMCYFSYADMDTLKIEIHKRKTNVASPVKKHVSEAQGWKTPYHCSICDVHFVFGSNICDYKTSVKLSLKTHRSCS